MKVIIQSVNFNADQKLLDLVDLKMKNLERFFDRIIGVEVYLKVQKTSDKENKSTEVKVKVPGDEIIVKKQSKTFEEGISLVKESLKRQLTRRKEKIRA